MEGIIDFIRQKNLHSIKDIILHKMKEYTTINKDDVDIEINFYEDGSIRSIILTNEDKEAVFRNSTDYYCFLIFNEVFESKGEHLLKRFIEKNSIKNNKEFIRAYSNPNSNKICIYLTRKLEFNIIVSFGKDFYVTDVLFLDEGKNEFAKLSSEEFYNVLNKLQINK